MEDASSPAVGTFAIAVKGTTMSSSFQSSSSSRHRGKSWLVAAMAGLSIASAHAADADLGVLAPSLSSTFQVGVGTPFDDTLSFDLLTDVTASFTGKGEGFVIPGVLSLSASPDMSFAIYKGGVALTGWGTSFSSLSLAAGTDYAFMVKGSSGGYSVTWSVTPVPEAGSLAMVIGGLGVAASVVRRRARKA